MPFSGTATVVPSRAYVHPVSRRTFSMFSAWVEPGSELVERGFTIAWSGDGTVGTCKPPFKTHEEAQAYADRWNSGER
jgi:hypothetical protein